MKINWKPLSACDNSPASTFRPRRMHHLKRRVLIACGVMLAAGMLEAADAPGEVRFSEIAPLLKSGRSSAKVAGAAQADAESPRVTRNSQGQIESLSAGPGREFPAVGGSKGDPEGAAKNFLKQNGKLFGVTSPAVDFQLKKKNSGKGRHSIRLTQTYEGVPVFGGEVVVQVNDDGGVEYVSANFDRDTRDLDDKRLSPKAKLTADEAAAAAQAHYAAAADGQALTVTPPELTLFVPSLLKMQGPKRLVWKMEIRSADETTVAQQVFIDAHSSGFVHEIPLMLDLLNRNIYDHNNNVASSAGTLVRSEGGSPAALAEANSAYDFLGDTYNFFFNRFGRDGIFDDGAPMYARVRYCDPRYPCPLQNAYGGSSTMYFGQGYTTDDICGHELAHGVTAATSGLIYQNESGAINESLSDVFGELVDLTNTGGTDTAGVRWRMGEDLPIGAIRDMKNPPAFNHPDWLGSSLYHPLAAVPARTNDHGGVHSNSGINNKLCYLLTDGATFRGRSITGMGINLVAALYYEATANLLISTSGWKDLANALRQAAINLDWTTAQRQNVENALAAVGLEDLGMALDTPPSLTWVNAGNAPWFYQTNITHDGVDAAQSGDIADSQSSYLETTVTGPGTLSFWWKVSSEASWDYLRYRLDGSEVGAAPGISGTVDWQQKTVSIPAGLHTNRWTYSKDGSVSSGSDAGWLDQVSYIPTVANTNDNGPFSLRQVIAEVPAGATIIFDPGLTGKTILLTNGQIALDKNLTINASALPGGITINGNHNGRIFEVASGTTVVLTSLTLTNGNGVGTTYSGNGGSILSLGNLTLNNCRLVGSQLSGTGGALTAAFGALTMNNTTVSGNVCGNVSGIYVQDQSVTLNGCTFSGNSGSDALRLNAAGGNASLTAINSTFSGNVAASGIGAAITVQSSTGRTSAATLYNCTVTSNQVTTAGQPGAIYLQPGTGTNTLTLKNTIVAGNTTGGSPLDITGTAVAGSVNNLIGTGGGLVNGVNGNKVGFNNPQLGPLGNNGGLTQTMTPLPGSPAIDAGNNAATIYQTVYNTLYSAYYSSYYIYYSLGIWTLQQVIDYSSALAQSGAAPYNSDQRGLPRFSGLQVDIGSVEAGAAAEIAVEQPVGTDLTDGTGTNSFGIVNVGSSGNLTFTIRNVGNTNLTGLVITKDGANPGEFIVGAPGSTNLAAGASTTFTVTFTPGALGERNAAVHIASSDSDENPFDIALTGTGVTPEIGVQQPAGTDLVDGAASIGFGTVNVGNGAAKTFTITNSGSGNLTGLAITKDGANAGDFIVGAPESTTVAPGGITKFVVTFSPLRGGSRSATIHIASNDGDENPFDIALTGSGSVLYGYSLTSDPGWARQGQWAFGQPTGSGGSAHGSPDPAAGATGTNVFGVNLGGDYSTTVGGPYYLTAGPLNFDGYTGTKLRFQRWLNTDYQPYVSATLEVSSNGTDWVELYNNGTNSPTVANSWSDQTHDISAIADNQSAVYVRWGYQVFSDALAYSGWNIDDVEFSAVPVPEIVVEQPVGTGLVDNTRYASTVLGFSSQYSAGNWSAAQALGEPNTFTYGDRVTAWAPSPRNGSLEFITVGFTTPIYASGAAIRETYGNGFVYKIDVLDLADGLHTVWTGTDPSQPGSPVDFMPTWPQTPYLVKGLKIYTDTDHNLSTWEEIDAIELHGAGPNDIDFGVVNVGSGSAAKTFTIRNTGQADLTGLVITKGGANTGDFIVGAPGATNLAPGASTTFDVTFNPLRGGSRSAVLHIASNDSDENPFDIAIQGSAPVFYSYPLASDPGWTRQGEWAFGQPTGSGGGNGETGHGAADPQAGASGYNVFGINLGGDYSTTVGGPYYLTTGPLNFAGYEGTTLRFQRWLNTDYQNYVFATVEVSTNGTNWVGIYNNGSSGETVASSWSQQTYDISSIADNQSAVYVRWGHRVGSSGAFAYSGWNIDDVEFFANSVAAGKRVLVIWDGNTGGASALSNALAAAGFDVTLSPTAETGYTGANPSPDGFNAVIHLNGSSYGADMPVAGQLALSNYVHNGGGYIQNEWDAYEYNEGRMQNMRDLILFDRLGTGGEGIVTLTNIPSQAGHPVLAGIPGSITFQAGHNTGLAHVFTNNPVTVLMREGTNDAVAVRRFGSGRVAGFHHAGNFAESSYHTLSDANVQRLYINAVRWAATPVVATTDGWNGTDYISAFGEPNTATYGQTFVAPLQSTLESFTVYLSNTLASVDFRFYVMAWDGVKATGPILYQSDPASTLGQTGWNPFTFHPGIRLTSGADYVAFVSASTLFNGTNGSARMGSPLGDSYSDGHFVYQNNGTNFAALTSSTWGSLSPRDLAFEAVFSTTPPIAPQLTGVYNSGAGTLVFNWSDPSFHLQVQTNTAEVGFSNNWVNLPGGATSPVVITPNPANPAVFYRLMSP